MSSLAFVLPGPVSAPSAQPLEHVSAKWAPQQSAKWSGSLFATCSATISAVVGRAVLKSRRLRTTSTKAFDPSKERGAMQPLGFWDPLHLMKEGFKNPEGETRSEDTFRWYRAAEIKHGRVAMLAVLGLPASTLGGTLDGGVSSLFTENGGSGMGIGILIAAILELNRFKQDPSRAAGDFDFDPARLGEPHPLLRFPALSQDEHMEDMRLKELNHGRLAMCGFVTSLWLEYGGITVKTQFSGGYVPPFAPLLFVIFAGVFWQGEKQFYGNNDAVMLPGSVASAKQIRG